MSVQTLIQDPASSPSPLGSMRLGIFAVFITLGLAWFILTASSFGYLYFCGLSLKSAWQQSGSEGLEQTAQCLEHEPRTLKYARNILYIHPPDAAATRRWLEILIAFRKGEFSRARSLYLGSNTEFRTELSTALIQNGILPNEWWESLETSFAKLALARENLKANETESAATVEEAESLDADAVLIRNDLSEVFSLPLPSKDTPLLFYQSGLLEDLPMLPALPVELADATELKTTLDKIGGRVRYEGPYAAELFSEELQKLRESSKNLKTKLDTTEAHLVVLATQRAQIEAEIQSREASIQSKIHQGLHSLMLYHLRPSGLGVFL